MNEQVRREPSIEAPRADSTTPARRRRKDRALVIGAAAALVAVGALSWWYWHAARTPPPYTPPPATAEPPPAAPVALAPPPIRHPIEADAASAPATLPPLADSDAYFARALSELLGQQKVRSMLRLDSVARNFVATVDNLGRDQASSRLWPVIPTPQRFAVRSQGADTVIDPDNALRYAAFVLMVESVDVPRMAALYRAAYPLFQQAYVELGYPKGYFNDRLVDVIDHLLAAPEPATPPAVRLLEVQGPMPLTRPWLHYEFVDPQLESLSAGQKVMVRVGPVNERRLKARLVAIRAAIAR